MFENGEVRVSESVVQFCMVNTKLAVLLFIYNSELQNSNLKTVQV